MNVSEGGTIELPCMKGIFPNPSNISWQRNGNQCDSVQCLVSDNLNISGIYNINMHITTPCYYYLPVCPSVCHTDNLIMSACIDIRLA